MNPFDANERHRYIIESGGNPVSSADGKEKEIWVNSINIDIDTPIYIYEMGIFTTVLFRTYA